MIGDVEDYFAKGCGRCPRFATADCSARRWAGGLAALRRLCFEAGLTETAKWGHPCYMHAGRNLAILGAFRSDFRLSFPDAALLTDPGGLLERQGPNARHPDALRFTSEAAVAPKAPAVRALLAEAKAHAEAGRRAPVSVGELELPDELRAALAADPALADAFRALGRGRRNSHVVALRGAKAPATRLARIARLRPRILAGKGATGR